jgi:hypothetical protein
VNHARGDLLLWTDDDVIVDPNWLGEYVRAATKWPEAVYFGGYIEPWFEHKPPKWLLEDSGRFSGLLVTRDFGPDERCFVGNEQPYGANMAFRLSLLRSVRFDPKLGKVRDECILSEESKLFELVRHQGLCGVWVPAARVAHHVPAERMKTRYVWKYFHGVGRTTLRLNNSIDTSVKTWRGVPRSWYRRCFELWCRAWFCRLSLQPDWIVSYTQAAFLAGQIKEATHMYSSSLTIADNS